VQHEPFGELDGDRLYGRGSSDMKGGVAAIAAAAIKVAAGKPKRAGLRLVLTAAEETGSLGARHVARSVLEEPSGPLVIAEPTANAVVHGHKGALWLEAVATGVTAHGSMPSLGDNAIYKLARAVSRFEEYGFAAGAHPVMGSPTLNVGTSQGGLNTNSVPDRAVTTVDVRTIAGQDHGELAAALARAAGPEVTLRPLIDLPPVWTDPAEEWARSATEIVRAVTGQASEPRAATYFTDASVLTPALGSVPTVICGPGEAELAHVTDEWCSLARLAESVEIFERLCAD
jgi:succinyl-diaminopimelate desuccinylase